MSRPPEHADGTPQAPPNVYHPQPTAPPAYEEFADPAAAHGWQNGYDETAQLPRVGDAGMAEEAADGYGESSGAGSGVAAGAGRRAHRRKRRSWGSRRMVAVAGAVGTVSAGALIAGFSLFGSSPADAPQGKQSRTSPPADESADPAGASGGDPPTSPSSDADEPTPTEAPDASGRAAASDAANDDDRTAGPSSAPSTTSAASSSPTATASSNAPGNSDDHPGKGQGATKGPR